MEPGVVDRLVLEVAGSVDAAALRLPSWLDGLATLGAAAAAALVGVTLASAQAADQAIKAARAVGLEVEAYTALRYAAGLAGVSEADLQIAAKTTARTLTDAATAGGAMAEAYRALGIDAEEAVASGRDFADLLPDILDGLAGIEDPIRRAAVGQRVLGEGAGKMASLVEAGGDALRAASDEARRYGIAITTDAAVASESLNDNLSRLTQRVTGVGRSMGLALVPAADRVVLALTDVFDAAQPAILWAVEGAATALTGALDALISPLGRVSLAIGAFGLATQAGRAGVALGPLLANVPILGAQLAKMAWTIGTVTAAAAPWAAAFLAVALAIDEVNTYLEGGDSYIGRWAESMGVDSELYAALTSMRDLISSVGDLFTAAGSAISGAFLWALRSVGEYLPVLQPILDKIEGWAKRFGKLLGTNATLSGFLTNLSRGAQVLAQSANLMSADLAAGKPTALPEGGFIGAAARRLAEIERDRVALRGGGATVQAPVTIQIDGAADPAAVAREVDRQIQRHTGAALAQVGG